jgi:hypothetical protein
MPLVATVAGIEQDQHVRLNAFGLTSNADGSVGFGGIVFDDSAGSLSIQGWNEVIVRETDCTDAPILFKGWIGDRVYSRQGEATYRIGSARWIDCNLVDANAALAIRLFVNPTAKRPAETDIRRINWLLGAADPGGLDGLVIDHGLVDRSTPRPFEEADYRGAYALDVLNDLAAPLGRIFFVYVEQGSGDFSLFYDFPTSTVATSPIVISNVLSDVVADTNGNTYAPYLDATLHRDPSAVVSLVRFVYRNGVVLEGDTTTETTFFSAAGTGGTELLNRGINTNNDRVGLVATARIMADGILAKNSVEEDTITVTVQLPSTKAGWIGEGQRVAVRFAHLPGYETSTYMRVQSRNIQHSQGTNLFYDVTLTLSNTGVHGTGGGGGTGPGDFPQPPATPGTIIQSDFDLDGATMPNPIEDGDLLVLAISSRSSLGTPTGYTLGPEGVQSSADWMAFFTKTASGDSQTTPPTISGGTGWWELSAGLTIADSSSASGSATGLPSETFSAGAVDMAAGDIALILFAGADGGVMDSGIILDDWHWVIAGAATEDHHGSVTSGHPAFVFAHYTATAAGSFTAQATFLEPISSGAFTWTAQVLVLHSDAATNPPPPAQETPWVTVTMTTVGGVSTGTTAFPYADRSLQVKVDGVIISPASFTETDGACGDFALSWEVDPDNVVQVSYKGR